MQKGKKMGMDVDACPEYDLRCLMLKE